jgi:hypothetical protein
MPVVGTPAFNAVTVMEIEAINFAARDIELVAHAAFVNTENGATYGSTTCRRWSKGTIQLLDELRRSMDEDVANVVFERDATGSSGPELPADVSGIGERLGGTHDVEPV